MHPTERVIEFILSLKWEALAPEIRHQAKRCLIDGLGALIAGSQTPAAELMPACTPVEACQIASAELRSAIS
jgi:2-methylcitrate dehydratase PrpD